MYKIVEKQKFSENVKLIVVEAPLVAQKARAGQFLIVRINEEGERIPLTIADCSAPDGTVSLIFQEVGKSTRQLGQLEVGDELANVFGPLGHPTEIQYFGKVVLVGGGIGIAPIYPIARALKEAGNTVLSIIGARTKELLFWEDRMQAVSNQLIVCTDDGSYGRKALVTEPLNELIEIEKNFDHVWAIGPAIMMKAVTETTRPYQIPTTVSLNTVMIDGTGMCGGCRVVMDEGWKFACVDGPEFDAHKVDWDILLSRLKFYRAEERLAVEFWEYHTCQLNPLLK